MRTGRILSIEVEQSPWVFIFPLKSAMPNARPPFLDLAAKLYSTPHAHPPLFQLVAATGRAAGIRRHWGGSNTCNGSANTSYVSSSRGWRMRNPDQGDAVALADNWHGLGGSRLIRGKYFLSRNIKAEPAHLLHQAAPPIHSRRSLPEGDPDRQ